MRGKVLSFAVLSGLAVIMTARPSAASACLPPPPDWVPPTEAERVRGAAQWASDIVYGEVTRGSMGRGEPRFRILHVYRGSLRPGATITAAPGWGLNPPICSGMMTSPPVLRGRRGVIVFSQRPELNFLSDSELALMLAEGLIQPRPADERRSR